VDSSITGLRFLNRGLKCGGSRKVRERAAPQGGFLNVRLNQSRACACHSSVTRTGRQKDPGRVGQCWSAPGCNGWQKDPGRGGQCWSAPGCNGWQEGPGKFRVEMQWTGQLFTHPGVRATNVPLMRRGSRTCSSWSPRRSTSESLGTRRRVPGGRVAISPGTSRELAVDSSGTRYRALEDLALISPGTSRELAVDSLGTRYRALEDLALISP